MTANFPAIDPSALASWLQDRVPSVEPPLGITLISGGKSNLTYKVIDQQGRGWILRRPPLHGVLPSAHDMGREYRILSALQDSEVPVPSTIGYESDISYVGSPFYVMDFVDGHVVRTPDLAMQVLDHNGRAAVGPHMVDVLLKLHSLDPGAVGLEDLSRPDDYLGRQLRAWGRQLEPTGERALPDIALMGDLRLIRDDLSSAVPAQQTSAIAHGDFRLDNVVISGAGEVMAVLDWELCTLGDPMADIAALVIYWSDPEDVFLPLETATVADGFLRRRDINERYKRGSGLDFSRFDYYLAFAAWRLAVILQGVLRRHDSKAYGDDPEGDWERFRNAVPYLIDVASEHLGADRRSR